jgi:hypothetical protein
MEHSARGELARPRRPWKRTAIAGLALGAVVLAACGSSNDLGSAVSDTSITVAGRSSSAAPSTSSRAATTTGGDTTTTPETSSPADMTQAVEGALADAPTKGPLRVAPGNGRYFVDSTGKGKLLVGSHTWPSLQDLQPQLGIFDYNGYLDFLVANNHNFFRLWMQEQGSGFPGFDGVSVEPMPYVRTGPGNGADGKPKFNLDQLNQAFFDRLRARVVAARDRGIYVSVMLFNGFSVDLKGRTTGNPCTGHPFNGANNVNGINVANGSSCASAHTLGNQQVTARQEQYVAKVIATVGDLDNVLYEISNESNSDATQWQYHMINFIKSMEAGRPMRHPVGMTVEFPNGNNAELVSSPADWISPNANDGHDGDPPAANGQKVVILDTDHLWGIGGDRQWLWRSITRGYNVLYMDCYGINLGVCEGVTNSAARLGIIPNLGYARSFLERAPLASMTPQSNLASSQHVLAKTGAGAAYLVYLPNGGGVTVNLSGTTGPLTVEWLNPSNGQRTTGANVNGGGNVQLTAPFGGDAVLFISTPGSGSGGGGNAGRVVKPVAAKPAKAQRIR